MKSDSLYGNSIEIRITYRKVKYLSGRTDYVVYVINCDGKPLMPCQPVIARLLLKQGKANIANIYDFKIIEMEVIPDHVHLFISCKPTISPTDIVRILKSITARRLFEEFPKLRKFYSKCGVLWSKGYFVCSIGNASPETLKRYIQEQKSKP